MYMAGFDRRKDPSVGTLDGLEVCVLALEGQLGFPFLMCVFDLLGGDIMRVIYIIDMGIDFIFYFRPKIPHRTGGNQLIFRRFICN